MTFRSEPPYVRDALFRLLDASARLVMAFGKAISDAFADAPVDDSERFYHIIATNPEVQQLLEILAVFGTAIYRADSEEPAVSLVWAQRIHSVINGLGDYLEQHGPHGAYLDGLRPDHDASHLYDALLGHSANAPN